LERIARQHLILEDNALFDDYAHVREDFRVAARELASLPLEPAQIATLHELIEQENRLFQSLTTPKRTPEILEQIVDGYAKLVDGTRAATAATNLLTQHAIERLQETASRGREKWLYVGLATVAIAIALAIVFAVLIARPIRQLDVAIRQMGTADFTHAIRVSGPQDLRYVGQRLEWLRAWLSELEQQQTRLLRHVSHEWKTPLTAVREGAELLRDNAGGKWNSEKQILLRFGRSNKLLDVVDEGPGVALGDRERIFDSFYQGPAPAEGRVKGSGRGLAIAREYAVVHGGRIELLQRSDGKHGAWFRLSLPLAAGAF